RGQARLRISRRAGHTEAREDSRRQAQAPPAAQAVRPQGRRRPTAAARLGTEGAARQGVAPMLGFRMVRKLRLMLVLAAIVVIAALTAPSLAVAHEGHAHAGHTLRAPAVEKAAAPSQSQSHKQAAAVDAASSIALLTAAPAETDARDARPTDDCAGHCCGGSAGMTCCGAALAPDLIGVDLVRTSVPFMMPHDLPPSGLPPEALPKPPKARA